MADMRRNGNIGRMMAVLAFGPPEGRACLQSNVPIAATKLQCDHLLEQAVLSGLCCPSIPPSDYLACIACRMSPTTRWSSLHMAGSPAQRTATSPHSYRPARAMRRQAGKSEEAALYVRRIHEANVVAAEAAKAAAEALAMAEELAAGLS